VNQLLAACHPEMQSEPTAWIEPACQVLAVAASLDKPATTTFRSFEG
jgi:hypothetical protein